MKLSSRRPCCPGGCTIDIRRFSQVWRPAQRYQIADITCSVALMEEVDVLQCYVVVQFVVVEVLPLESRP